MTDKEAFTLKLKIIIKLFSIREKYVESGSDNKKTLKLILDNALDDLSNEDFFGTEGQLDPRGDQRESKGEYFKIDDKRSLKDVVTNLQTLVATSENDEIEYIENAFNETFQELYEFINPSDNEEVSVGQTEDSPRMYSIEIPDRCDTEVSVGNTAVSSGGSNEVFVGYTTRSGALEEAGEYF